MPVRKLLLAGPDWFEGIKLPAQIAAGMVAAFVGNIPALTQLLVIMMVIDTVFGTWVAITNKELSSDKAWKGATKKVGSLLLIASAAIIQHYVKLDLGVDLVQTASAFYLVGELVSITRNAVRLEILVPPQFAQVIDYFEGFSGMKKESPVAGGTPQKETDETPVPQNPG